MIWVNFKTYKEASGNSAVKLARICEAVSQAEQVVIIPVVQAFDLYRVAKEVKLPVWAQHVDHLKQEANTGWLTVEALINAGGEGSLLNHSEKKLTNEIIGKTIKSLKKHKLKSLICSASVAEAQQLVKFKPDFLAYEPIELIGSRVTSVSQAKPEIIEKMVKTFPGYSIVVGAGIHSTVDVIAALKLGARGILVSSDVVLADNPRDHLTRLALGFKKV